MIRKNTINCKLFLLKNLKISGLDLVTDNLSDISLLEERCPNCGLKGGCSLHGYYQRNLIDFADEKPIVRQITIPRVICPCGSSHAILPDPIIPYLQYSLFYILMVLSVYSCHIMTVEKLCQRYYITPPVLYRWLKVYDDHRPQWQGILKSTCSDILHSLYELSHRNTFMDFAIEFIRTTGTSFLQTHSNPANCRRNLQYAFFPEAVHITC